MENNAINAPLASIILLFPTVGYSLTNFNKRPSGSRTK